MSLIKQPPSAQEALSSFNPKDIDFSEGKSFTFFGKKSQFLFFILVITFLRIIFIEKNCWPINGDEAQYWGWSKALDFGYYSKPPMIAWLISISTYWLGDASLGLRIASPLCHAVTAVIIYLIGTRLFNERTGFWCGVIYLLVPGVTFSSTLISTDVPLLLFWSLSFYFLVRALQSQKNRFWIFSGIALGFALLSKYVALFFVISLFLYLIFEKEKRFLLRTAGPYLCLSFALLIFLPNLIWNYHHDFVSWVEVKNNAKFEREHAQNLIAALSLHLKTGFAFIGAQFAVFGPILFSFLLALLISKNRKDSAIKLLLFFSLPLLFAMTVQAFVMHAMANWAVAAYVTATISVVAFMIKNHKILWLKASVILHGLIFACFFFIQPLIQFVHLPVAIKMNTINWSEAGKQISALRANHENASLLVDGRMLMALCMYFAKVPLKDTYKWNPKPYIADHYDMVTHLQNSKGRDFIVISYSSPTEITHSFTQMEKIATIPLQGIDGRSINLYAYYAKHFNGYAGDVR